jgi:hypothetical protein
MLPPAPTRFSTTTLWPSACASGSASVRATKSGEEPPGKPTMSLSVLLGQIAWVLVLAAWARGSAAASSVPAP